MTKREETSDPTVAAWFAAVGRGDTRTLGALLLEGFDIDTRDARGRTALFHAIAPHGGNPETVRWLVTRGADVTIRDHDGIDALAWGSAGVSSGLEANMMSHARDLFERHGYPRRPPVKPASTAKAAPAPTPPAPALRLEDLLGVWEVVDGPAAGQRLDVGRDRIHCAWAPLRLVHASATLVATGLTLDGEHAGLAVTADLRLRDDGGATLTWSDGVTFPATFRLSRPARR